MPNASAIRYRKNMYAPYLFSKICIQILLYPQSNSHTPFRKPCCIYIQHIPCHVFHFLSPGVGRNMQDRPGMGCLNTPAAPLSRHSYPRTPPRLPCSPAEVSLSPGFQDSLPALPHAGNAAHIFPSSVTIPRSTCIKVLPHTLKQANISPRSSPLIIFQCPGCFVSLHTDIPFRQV